MVLQRRPGTGLRSAQRLVFDIDESGSTATITRENPELLAHDYPEAWLAMGSPLFDRPTVQAPPNDYSTMLNCALDSASLSRGSRRTGPKKGTDGMVMNRTTADHAVEYDVAHRDRVW